MQPGARRGARADPRLGPAARDLHEREPRLARVVRRRAARRRAGRRRRGDAHAAPQRPGVPAHAPARRAGAGVRHRAGARRFLEAEGMSLAGDDEPVDAVFVAHADTVDFPLLERAARAIIAGAPAPDRELRARLRRRGRPDPQPRRDDHGRAREGEQHPPVIVGKPSRAAMRTVEEQVGVPAERARRDRRRPDDGHRARPPRRRADGPRRQRDQRPSRPATRSRSATARTPSSAASPSCSSGSEAAPYKNLTKAGREHPARPPSSQVEHSTGTPRGNPDEQSGPRRFVPITIRPPSNRKGVDMRRLATPVAVIALLAAGVFAAVSIASGGGLGPRHHDRPDHDHRRKGRASATAPVRRRSPSTRSRSPCLRSVRT